MDAGWYLCWRYSKGDFGDVVRYVEAMSIPHEPEILVYLARHYFFIGLCAPYTLRSDEGLKAARTHPEFGAMLADAGGFVDQAYSILRRSAA
jgi:hypothetical protein